MKRGFVHILFLAAMAIFVIALAIAVLPAIFGIVGASYFHANPVVGAVQNLAALVFLGAMAWAAWTLVSNA